MRKITILLPILLSILTLQNLSAQVEWSAPMVGGLGGSEYRVMVTAKLDEGWHMYDLVVREGGANATEFNFEESLAWSRVGEVSTTHPAIVKYDEIFAMEIGYYKDEVTFVQDITLAGDGAQVDFEVEWMLCNDMSCLPPAQHQFSVMVGQASNAGADVTDVVVDAAFSRDAEPARSSLWWVVVEAMLWGFAALLTPCVFPMVPMTISFFLKGQEGARGRVAAGLYGAFIVGLYTLPIAAMILITRVLGGDAVTADIFNWVATHWFPNLLFFVVFVLFAASFFGAFEIVLPSKWVNESDSRADRGSIGGIFFLALTLVLVSFSCTGPIVGSVLIKSAAGEFWEPIITMLAFSFAFALPFVAVALSPSLVGKLPKSGGWLGSVKIVLGFLELALALKFLSVADQIYRWGILSRELYLVLWIVIFSLLGLYLLGLIRIGERVRGAVVVRLCLAVLVFGFVAYITPGLWGAPLRPLAGYLPPIEHDMTDLKSRGDIKYADLIGRSMPQGLPAFYDLQQAQEYALRVGKPMLLDFTGHGCVNCREMEQRVWSDPAVDKMLREDYVIVALYMDDKSELPSDEWVTTPSGRVLKSIGRVNSYMAQERYGVNSQPTYIPIGNDLQPLTPPRGYDLSIDGYIGFLREGLRRYNLTR